MKRLLPTLLLSAIAGISFAQKPLYSTQHIKLLEKSAKQVAKQENNTYQKALRVAQKRGWFVERYYHDGRRISLQGITETGEPIYVTTFSNVASAATTRTNTLQEGGSLGLNLTGGSSAMSGRLGIWDGGKVRSDHVELTGRVSQQDNNTTNNVHSTHVAGTMIASGVNPPAKGMATAATLNAWDYNSDLSEMTSASSSLLVSNHSYGQLAGWQQDDDGTWRWYGDDKVSVTQDYKFGYYSSIAQSFDKLAVNAPYYLICFASGNSRDPDGSGMPSSGTSYYVGSGSTTSTVTRSSNGSFDNIATYATAKNILTVGAIYAVPNGINQPADVDSAYFSSAGPTDDGRIKPDIVGVGVNVLSSTSTATDAYTTLSGTSMATPNVSGSIFLLQEYYNQKNSSFMRSSTLKGLIIHTAQEAGTTGPDYMYGWGVLNAEQAAKTIQNSDNTNLIAENTLTSGQTYTQQVVASGEGPLRVTIAWIDPAGTPLTIDSTVLNNRSPRLVNDLDLRVSDGTTTTQPYTLNPDSPATAATTGDNIRDNVEQVLIANPVPGQTYTITISHKNTLSTDSQAYSLIVSGIGGTTYCTSTASDTTVSHISNVVFGTISNTSSSCASTVSVTNQVGQVAVGQSVAYSITVADCQSSGSSKIVKLFADWNLDGDYDDSDETLATSGTLSSGGIFSGNVTIPTTLTVGQYIPLRIVAAETSDASSVSSCGTYSAGQTQQYILKVVDPTNDVAITSFVSPTSNFCAPTLSLVQVQVKNYGTASQTNVPVTVQVLSNGQTIGTFSGEVSLDPYELKTLNLTGSVTVSASTTYTFTSTITLASDQKTENNTSSVSLTTADAITPDVTAQSCGTDGNIALKNNSDGTAYWYDSASDGTLIAVGNQTSISALPSSGTIYAGINDYSGTVGPTTKSAFTGGGYNQFSPSVTVHASVPVVLESARLYVGNSGSITLTASKSNGTVVSTTTIDVTATRTTPGSGAQTDDTNDQGAVYPLNLTLPDTGTYSIAVTFNDGATLFRSNAGVTGYPFSLSGVFSITGNSAGSTSQYTYYYYFYNLQVKASGCASARVAVPVTAGSSNVQAQITPSDTVTFCTGRSVSLQANTGTDYTYQWYLNGTAISGATSQTYTATATGSYTVQLTVADGCQTISAATVVTNEAVTTPTITVSGLTLTASSAAAYQWYLNGTAISGATSQTYTATAAGSYTVTITSSSGCQATSAATTITITATEPTITEVAVSLLPNPTTDKIRIDYQAPDADEATIQIFTTDGKKLGSQAFDKSSSHVFTTEVDVTTWAKGVYIVRISDDKRTISKRFIKN
ncbi:MAG: S8 family serine peptidase [Siphonobacter sp.]